MALLRRLSSDDAQPQREAEVWDCATAPCVLVKAFHGPSFEGLVTDAIFTPDGRSLAMPHRHVVRVWDLKRGPIAPLPSHTLDLAHEYRTMVASTDGSRIAIGDFDGGVRLYDAAWSALSEPLSLGSEVMQLAMSEDGASVLAALPDGSAHLWDTSRPDAAWDGTLLARPNDEEKWVSEALSTDAGLFAAGVEGGEVNVWRTAAAGEAPWSRSLRPSPPMRRPHVVLSGTTLAVYDRAPSLSAYDLAAPDAAGSEQHVELGIDDPESAEVDATGSWLLVHGARYDHSSLVRIRPRVAPIRLQGSEILTTASSLRPARLTVPHPTSPSSPVDVSAGRTRRSPSVNRRACTSKATSASRRRA
jgi:hypothetical protein